MGNVAYTVTYDRWKSLWDWCQSLGSCVRCATNMACAIAQREANNREWGQPHACERCKELVRTNWKDSPR